MQSGYLKIPIVLRFASSWLLDLAFYQDVLIRRREFSLQFAYWWEKFFAYSSTKCSALSIKVIREVSCQGLECINVLKRQYASILEDNISDVDVYSMTTLTFPKSLLMNFSSQVTRKRQTQIKLRHNNSYRIFTTVCTNQVQF